jgi:hypothetical protein
LLRHESIDHPGGASGAAGASEVGGGTRAL